MALRKSIENRILNFIDRTRWHIAIVIPILIQQRQTTSDRSVIIGNLQDLSTSSKDTNDSLLCRNSSGSHIAIQNNFSTIFKTSSSINYRRWQYFVVTMMMCVDLNGTRIPTKQEKFIHELDFIFPSIYSDIFLSFIPNITATPNLSFWCLPGNVSKCWPRSLIHWYVTAMPIGDSCSKRHCYTD